MRIHKEVAYIFLSLLQRPVIQPPLKCPNFSDWLNSQSKMSDLIYEALLKAWISILRYETLSRVERDKGYMLAIQRGEGFLYLDNELVPEEWDKESIWSQMALRTGLSHQQVRNTFILISEKIRSLGGEKAFEPVGWFRLDDDSNKGFKVLLWQDFLQQKSYRMEQITFQKS